MRSYLSAYISAVRRGCAVLIIISLLAPLPAFGQQALKPNPMPARNAQPGSKGSAATKSQGKNGSPTSAEDSSKATAKQGNDGTEKTAQSTTSKPATVQGDYIPCKFTVNELNSLISPETPEILTAADAEDLKQQVINAAVAEMDGEESQSKALDEFLQSLTKGSLTGLTPSEALSRVIADLSSAKDAAKSAAKAPLTASDADVLKKKGVGLALAAEQPVVGAFFDTIKGEITDKTLQVTAEDLPDQVDNWLSKLSDKQSLTGDSSLAKVLKADPEIPKEVKDNPAYGKDLKTDVTKALKGLETPISNAIVDAARSYLTGLERPPDVGCAMSMLSYRETDTAYGFKIAREYIAVQVVVRNLSHDQAFVLHDAEFQVNIDPEGRYGRFFSGRDKVIVRALSAAQSDFDPRAIVVHAAEGTGAILSAIVPIFNAPNLTNASAVFNGAVVPGLDKYWKDQTSNQLNLLNDTGFSSQTNSQTTVPQLGTSMFVIFIPSKQFDEGWWTQPCVERVYIGHRNAKGVVEMAGPGLPKRSIAGDGTNPDTPASPEIPGTLHGIEPTTEVNVSRALEACTQDREAPPRHHGHWYTLGHRSPDEKVGEIDTYDDSPMRNSQKKTSAGGGGGSGEAASPPVTQTTGVTENSDSSNGLCPSGMKEHCGADLFRNLYQRPYRQWPGNSLQIFAALSNVVVAGTHITDDKQLQSSISTLTCPKNNLGDVSFPSPDKGTLQCNLTGKNLEKVEQLRLRNAKDQSDPQTAEGTVSVTGDATKATVSFPTPALHALPQPAYTVYAVSSKGTEDKTGQTLHFSGEAVVTSIDPDTVDFAAKAATPKTITIKGYHLAKIDAIVLKNDSAKAETVTISLTQDALKEDTALTVQLDPGKLGVFKEAKSKIDVTLQTGGKAVAGTDATGSFVLTGPDVTDAKPVAPKSPK